MDRSGTVLWQQLWLGLVKAAVLGALGEAAAGLHGPARGTRPARGPQPLLRGTAGLAGLPHARFPMET